MTRTWWWLTGLVGLVGLTAAIADPEAKVEPGGVVTAFSPAVTEAAGIRLEIPRQPLFTAIDQPRAIPVLITNLGQTPVRGTVRARVVDTWRIEGPAQQPFEAAPGQEVSIPFQVVAGEGTFSLYYPLHADVELVRNGQPAAVHTVLIMEAELPGGPRTGRLPERTVTALRAPEAMTIDGHLAEWTDAAALAIGAADLSTGAASPEDYSATAFAMWDATALYLAVEATDDDLSGQDETSPDWMNSDYVRVVFSRLPTGRTETTYGPDDLVLVLTPTSPTGEPRAKVVTYGGAGRTDFDLGAVRQAVNRDAAGWRLEVALPWAALGVRPAAGAEYGFNLMLGDADGGAREAEFTLGGTVGQYWTDPGMLVPLRLSEQRRDPSGASLPVLTLAGRGALPLARVRAGRLQVEPFEGQATVIPAGQTNDPASGTSWVTGGRTTRGTERTSIGFHPPWRGGKGTVSADYRLALPETTPITFETGLAIRDHNPEKEPPSDGVTFIVQVAPAGGEFREIDRRHTDAKVWEQWEVDLSAFAGQTVTLRLTGHPGPKHDTTCDSAYFGDPLVRVGRRPEVLTAVEKEQLTAAALAAARRAGGGGDGVAMPLRSACAEAGFAYLPGKQGPLDGAFAFAGRTGAVAFDGFQIEIDRAPVDELRLVSAADGVYDYLASVGQRELPVRLTVVDTGLGAVKLGWSMPGVTRDRRGQPRFTRLCLGPANDTTHRLYFGHGHVLQGSPRVVTGYGGFSLSTRYIGVDYSSGLSLVTGTEPFPTRLEHEQATRFTSLVADHDATFCLVPSDQGAFAAARVWRQTNDIPMSPGVPEIRGKMCIDQWGGDYALAARGLRLATAYGLDEAVFVKHVWQRWGYDYRLPDIYPPAGDQAAFNDMAAAAKLNGRLFAPHDNYIDIYPDCEDFSYNLTMFTEAGTPRLAWWNNGRQARAYKFLPQAFWPFFERNLALMKEGFDPNSIFIDVFSAMAPTDYYDHTGEFFSKVACADWWGRSFDRVREVFGGPTISEAGHDALIGHLDAAQADHLTVIPGGGKHILGWNFDEWDRTPWFDMGHHGKFVLFAGGLGGRYQAERPTKLHGYGSDDYLSLTVLGGRTPMCDGPFYRRTVMTYYLLQPICAELERQEMLAHRFLADSVRRQEVTWSDGKVTVNRHPEPLRVGDRVLPEYGFWADAGGLHADISLRDGQVTAMASGPNWVFVDARPPDDYHGQVAAIHPEAYDFEQVGPRQMRFKLRLDIREPVATSNRLFVHLAGEAAMLPGWSPNSDILFQGSVSGFDSAMLGQPGTVVATVSASLPEGLLPGELTIKFGFYDPANGSRLPIRGIHFGDGRYHGGVVQVSGTGAETKLVWAPADERGGTERDNRARRQVDFGPAVTNAAFRLEHEGAEWLLTLLPGSGPSQVQLRLDQLGAAGRRVARIEELNLAGEVVAAVDSARAGDLLTFRTSDQAFRYRLVLGQ